jgi:hypothetical protein
LTGLKASIGRKTLWSELADNLGSHVDFEAEDSEMHPVHGIGKIKALFKVPTLHSLNHCGGHFCIRHKLPKAHGCRALKPTGWELVKPRRPLPIIKVFEINFL